MTTTEPAPAPYVDPVLRAELTLIKVGLTGYQARVLVALVERDGVPAGSDDLADMSGVPRTSVYATARTLVGMGLVTQVDVPCPRRWLSGNWSMTRFRLRSHIERGHAEQVRALDELDPG